MAASTFSSVSPSKGLTWREEVFSSLALSMQPYIVIRFGAGFLHYGRGLSDPGGHLDGPWAEVPSLMLVCKLDPMQAG